MVPINLKMTKSKTPDNVKLNGLKYYYGIFIVLWLGYYVYSRHADYSYNYLTTAHVKTQLVLSTINIPFMIVMIVLLVLKKDKGMLTQLIVAAGVIMQIVTIYDLVGINEL